MDTATTPEISARLATAEKNLVFYRKLLGEAKEHLLGIGHPLTCALLASSDGECNCRAAEVDFLLTRIDLALEG